MTLRRNYSCNICGDGMTNTDMFGLHFTVDGKFTLGGYGCTEGTHICYNCARQLKVALNNTEISKILEVPQCQK